MRRNGLLTDFVAFHFRTTWNRPTWYPWPMGCYRGFDSMSSAQYWLKYRTRLKTSPKGTAIVQSRVELDKLKETANPGLLASINAYLGRLNQDPAAPVKKSMARARR